MLIVELLSDEYIDSLYQLIKTFSNDYVMLPRSIDELRNTAEHFVVIVDNKKVIGCAMLDKFTNELAEVKSLAVDKAYQGQGLGKLLVQSCESKAKAMGIKRLFALTYKDSFFHNLGFKTVSMETLPEKVYRECVRCHYYNDCKEIAVVKDLIGGAPFSM